MALVLIFIISNFIGLQFRAGRYKIPAQQQAPNVGCNGNMTLQNFIQKINWRQIIMHFIASWFFIHSFQTLSYLHNTKLIDILQHSNGQSLSNELFDNDMKPSDLYNSLIWINVSGFLGLLVAGLISLAISIRRHWLWVNTLIVFAATYILNRLDFLGWIFLKQLVWNLGRILNNSTAAFSVIGIILLIIGILAFSLRRSIRFIENYKMASL